jgi:hypothetical protein
MKLRHWIVLVSLAAASLSLSACAGALPLPEGFSFEVEPAEASELEFTALVDAIGPEAWTIGGMPVGLSAFTEISGSPQVGDLVKVHASAVAEVGLIAREIERVARAAPAETPPASPASGEEIEFVGAVTSIGAARWTIGDRTIAISPQTEIKGVIAVGDLVKVHARVQSDLSLTAREIEPAEADDLEDGDVDDLDHEDVRFRGTVQSMGGQTWLVGGLSFLVTDATDIRDDVRVGDFVEIRAVLLADGQLFATRIELEDEDDDRSGPNRGGDDDRDDDDEDDDEDDDHDDDDGDDDDDDRSGSNPGPG